MSTFAVDSGEWQTILGLKGIALLRQGKHSYAIQLAKEIQASNPTEDDAIQLCAKIYRFVGIQTLWSTTVVEMYIYLLIC